VPEIKNIEICKNLKKWRFKNFTKSVNIMVLITINVKITRLSASDFVFGFDVLKSFYE